MRYRTKDGFVRGMRGAVMAVGPVSNKGRPIDVGTAGEMKKALDPGPETTCLTR